mmetsp:Transcript_5228/g.7991  ORF Transcript_5228/g.7991 Transcript_5228/m.7991 type:complete len:189 (-) Transcript_5228:100-666(-)
MLTKSIILAAASSLLICQASSTNGDKTPDDDIKGYCVKACDTDNPCGDSKGQSDTCISMTFNDASKFGYNSTTIPSGFLGCSYSVCQTACANMNATADMYVQGDTFCFPKKAAEMDGMYMNEDMAKMSAISRGCAGAHFMNMYMIGAMHSDCVQSYDSLGVTYSSSSASVKVSLLVGVIGSIVALVLV